MRNSAIWPGATVDAPDTDRFRAALAARVGEIHADVAKGLVVVVPSRTGPPTDHPVLPVLRTCTTRVAVSPAITDTGAGVASSAAFQYRTRNQFPCTPFDANAFMRS